MATKKAEPEAVAPTGVRYIGTSDSRLVSKSDFEAAGVDSQESLEWGPENGFSVSLDDVSGAAFELLLKDPDFIAEY